MYYIKEAWSLTNEHMKAQKAYNEPILILIPIMNIIKQKTKIIVNDIPTSNKASLSRSAFKIPVFSLVWFLNDDCQYFRLHIKSLKSLNFSRPHPEFWHLSRNCILHSKTLTIVALCSSNICISAWLMVILIIKNSKMLKNS